VGRTSNSGTDKVAISLDAEKKVGGSERRREYVGAQVEARLL
jgi:hypothetical protein